MKKLFDFLFLTAMFLFAFTAFGYGAFRISNEWFGVSVQISVCVACTTSALIPFLLWRYTYSLALQAETELQQVVSNNNISKIVRS